MTKIGYIPRKSVKNNVSYFLELIAKKEPNKPVFYWVNPELLKSQQNLEVDGLQHQLMTFVEFTTLTSKIASGYLKVGLKRGDRVIVFLPMITPLYLAMSALQRIGAIPVFLDSWTRHVHMKICIEQVKPVAVISFEKAFTLLKSIPEFKSIPLKISVGQINQSYSASLEELMKSLIATPIAPVKQEETALITFTTGSSGTPKGADRSHRFLTAQHYALNKCIPYKKSDIDLPIFPVFSLNNIASGISTVLPAIDISTLNPTDSSILIGQIKNCNVNCATLSPSIFNNLSNYCIQNNIKLSQLKRVVTGGAPISRNNIIQFKSVAENAEIVILYGSTEVEPISKISDKELLSFKSKEDEDSQWVDEGVNVGRIVQGLSYKLIRISKNPITINSKKDWKLIEVKNKKVGELIVTGEHVCQKYFKNKEAFNRAKIVDIDGKIWHRTGDLVRIDNNGYFWIVGRVHNSINRDGIYVFPVRAEVVLKKLSFVAKAAYLGLPDTYLGEKIAVVIEPHSTIPKNKKKWELVIKEAFEKNNLPIDEIFIVENIPMDPRHHSKVEYNLLRKQIINRNEYL